MRYGADNVTTFVMLALVGWQIFARFRFEDTSNTPLVFYVFLFGFSQSFDDVFHFNVVLAGLCAAALLRFEFLGKKARSVVVALEMGLLGYFGLTLFRVLFS